MISFKIIIQLFYYAIFQHFKSFFRKGDKRMMDVTLLEGERIDRVNEDIVLIQKKAGLTFGTDAFLLAA